MSFYAERVVPHLVDLACGSKGFRCWRAEVASGLTGTVVEIGFGSGRNLEHLPDAVTQVLAVEPSSVAMHMARRRMRGTSIPVEHVGLDGQAIALATASCDSALCTFSLCTIPDPSAALREVHRVLRPGGELHFLEHGLAPDARVAALQRRLDPLERRLAGGCHLSRDPVTLAHEAGFMVVDVKQQYGAGPKPWTWFSRGMALRVGE